jgi:hypothetical protein
LIYLLFPPAVKLATWYIESSFWAGIVRAAAAASACVLGFALGYFCLSLIFGVQESPLFLYALFVGGPLVFAEWKFAGWVESWVDVSGKIEQNMAEKVNERIDKLARALDNMGVELNRSRELEGRRQGEILDSLRDSMEKSAVLEERFSGLLEHGRDYQTVLEKIREAMFDMLNEVKELRKNTPPPETGDQTRSPPPEKPAPLAPSEKPTPAPRRLTTEDGRRARLSGTEWQKKLAERVQELVEGRPVKVEVHLEKGKPDLVLRHRSTGKPLAVGAGKAYTLLSHRSGKPGSSQRTVTREMIVAELKFAKSHRLPLFIVVVNQRTGVQWFMGLCGKELDAFERITTPAWLAEDQPPQEEVERNHREFIEFLKSLV